MSRLRQARAASAVNTAAHPHNRVGTTRASHKPQTSTFARVIAGVAHRKRHRARAATAATAAAAAGRRCGAVRMPVRAVRVGVAVLFVVVVTVLRRLRHQQP